MSDETERRLLKKLDSLPRTEHYILAGFAIALTPFIAILLWALCR